ncbi:MAG: hypothetical protein LBD98_03280 [Endomicrobium sp.]|jgi:hypothetical protein|nr:hypothetical protein [Endomicrobium sp.]
MNWIKKSLAVVLSVVLITSVTLSREVEAIHLDIKNQKQWKKQEFEAKRAAEIERNRFADENIVYWTALATDPLAQEKTEAIRWDIKNREQRERQRQAYKKEKKERAELERNRFANENIFYCPDYLAQEKIKATRLEEQDQSYKDEKKRIARKEANVSVAPQTEIWPLSAFLFILGTLLTIGSLSILYTWVLSDFDQVN